jgi:hypothetical protein
VIDGDGFLPCHTVSQLAGYAKLDFPIIFLKSVPTSVSGVYNSSNCTGDAIQTHLNDLVAHYPTLVATSPSLDALPQTLSKIGVKPKVAFTGGTWFHTMWKSDVDPSTDYVYFWNPNNVTETSFSADFPETRYPFKVDAWTGSFSPIVEYQRYGSTISTVLNLQSNGSIIIAFSRNPTYRGQRSPSLSVTDSDKTILGFSSHNGSLIAQALGDGSVTLSDGKVVQIQANVSVPFTLNDWNITIEDWHPTFNLSSTETEITNHSILNIELKPWADYNLPNVSGIGHYATNFTLSSPNAKLSLGNIQHTATICLNGHELPPIDLFDAVIDISNFLRIGMNELQIDVTTTLFNAVKSRSSTITTAGVPASLANALLSENATSVKYGLLGPVTVTAYQAVKVA